MTTSRDLAKRLAVALVVEGDTPSDVERIVLDVIHTYDRMTELVAAFDRVERWTGPPLKPCALSARYALIREAIAAGADPDGWRSDEVVTELAEIEASVLPEFRAALDALDHRARRSVS